MIVCGGCRPDPVRDVCDKRLGDGENTADNNNRRMGTCINSQEAIKPAMKRSVSKKTSIEVNIDMTNSMRKIRKF